MPQTVFPCMSFRDAKASIAFLEKALGAECLESHTDDQGRIVHAEIRIGRSVVMAGDEREGGKATPPGVSVIYVVVDDADAAHERARAAGADVTDITEQDYGSRDFTVTDPEGNRWALGTYRGADA